MDVRSIDCDNIPPLDERFSWDTTPQLVLLELKGSASGSMQQTGDGPSEEQPADPPSAQSSTEKGKQPAVDPASLSLGDENLRNTELGHRDVPESNVSEGNAGQMAHDGVDAPSSEKGERRIP